MQTKEQKRECSHNRYIAHRVEQDARARERRLANPEETKTLDHIRYLAQFDNRLKRSYGITEEEYNDLLTKQGGKCAVCGKDNTGYRNKDGKWQRMFVDHDHKTGKVRGLLCHTCNISLGWLEVMEESGNGKLLREYLQKPLL